MNLDTFFTTLCVWIDDWYKAVGAAILRRHAGPELTMSDSGVLTLGLIRQWQVGFPLAFSNVALLPLLYL